MQQINTEYLCICNILTKIHKLCICDLYNYIVTKIRGVEVYNARERLFAPLNLSNQELSNIYDKVNILDNTTTFYIRKLQDETNNSHGLFAIIKNNEPYYTLMHCLHHINESFIDEDNDFTLTKQQILMYKHTKWVSIDFNLYEKFKFNPVKGTLKKNYYHRIQI